MKLNFSRTEIPAELKIAVELKFGGDPLMIEDPKAKWKEVSRTKMQQKCAAELKFLVELKWGDPWADEDPKSNCKEVSRTKTQLKLQWN